MLIYVIPLVILVIVLVILNQRQKAQESDKPKKTATKPKKSGASAKVVPKKTQVVESSVVEKKATTALTTDTRDKIEKLIAERNFFSAEAQINQSLKRDHSQHELYLYLLDIHILQKDEFAISQLLSHIRSLELDDILTQAEAKKVEFESTQQVKEVSTTTSISPAESTATINTSDFDALMDPTPVKSSTETTTLTTDEHKPLDFNFNAAPAIVEETPTQDTKVDETQPLEFDLGSIQPSKTNTTDAQVEVPVTKEIKPLDFSLDFAPTSEKPAEVVTEVESPAEKIEPLDFSFTTEARVKEDTVTETPALNFDLSSFDVAKTESLQLLASISI